MRVNDIDQFQILVYLHIQFIGRKILVVDFSGVDTCVSGSLPRVKYLAAYERIVVIPVFYEMFPGFLKAMLIAAAC